MKDRPSDIVDDVNDLLLGTYLDKDLNDSVKELEESIELGLNLDHNTVKKLIKYLKERQ